MPTMVSRHTLQSLNLNSLGVGGASVDRALVGGASAAGIDSRSKSGDGFSRPKAPLAKQ